MTENTILSVCTNTHKSPRRKTLKLYSVQHPTLSVVMIRSEGTIPRVLEFLLDVGAMHCRIDELMVAR